MIDVLKAFYTIHYNFAAVSVLLLALNIFLLTKKNYKWSIIFVAVLIAFKVLNTSAIAAPLSDPQAFGLL